MTANRLYDDQEVSEDDESEDEDCEKSLIGTIKKRSIERFLKIDELTLSRFWQNQREPPGHAADHKVNKIP